MKWEKTTFGGLKAGDMYEVNKEEAGNTVIRLNSDIPELVWVMSATPPTHPNPNTPVYRLIADAPAVDAKWVEKAAHELAIYDDYEKSLPQIKDEFAAIIRRHAPAKGVDVSGVKAACEEIMFNGSVVGRPQLEDIRFDLTLMEQTIIKHLVGEVKDGQ